MTGRWPPPVYRILNSKSPTLSKVSNTSLECVLKTGMVSASLCFRKWLFAPSTQPSSLRLMSINSGSLLLTSLELADLWNPVPSLHRCNTSFPLTIKIVSPATPDAPGTPDATEVTGESITLSWTPPKSDGGSPIHYYILEKREKKTVRFYKVITKKPITDCAHRVINLTEDMEYEFRVMAVNDAGVGTPSNISLPIKAAEPKDIPCAPSVVCVSDSTSTSISLEWTKPADDGGMEILGYIIEMVKGEEVEWKRVNEELVTETNYVVTGLQTGAEYKFRVAAVNHVGRGEDKEIPDSQTLSTPLRS
uniref:Fibronectin type-III domain-containing protein n=2 Tax=Haplochromini TaxID=319058 RepID=A0A3B4HBM5_9CICH